MHSFTLIPLIGQVFILIMACFALLVSAIARHTRQQHVYHLAQFALLAAIFLFVLWINASGFLSTSAFCG